MRRGAVMLVLLMVGCGDDEPTVIVPTSVDGAVAPTADMAMAAAPSDLATAPAPSDLATAAPQIIQVAVGPGGTNVFSPSTVSIRAGDTVRWLWQSGSHTVTSGTPGAADGDFCSISGTPGAASCNNANYATTPPYTYEHTFASAGNFPYFCVVHGAGMTGTVTVTTP